jgi:phage protein D
VEESVKDSNMITPVRTARPSIILNGQDFFLALAPYFLNLSYTDNSDGEKADDLQIQLADRDRRFINDWMPDKGVYVDVEILCERWFAPNSAMLKLDCGRFWIDSIDFELPQHTVSIKASSIPTDNHIKASDETRGWEGSDLKTIAEQIAGENKMEVQWESEVNPKYKRIEQTEESGLGFLKKRANDAKLAIKVCRNKLIFFDEQTYEEAEPSFTLVYGNAMGGGATFRMSGGHFATKMNDTKKGATVSYVNPETGRLTKEKFKAGDDDVDEDREDNQNDNADFEPDESGGGGVLVRTGFAQQNWDDVDPGHNAGKGAGGASAGQRKAKSIVRDANKDKETASVELSIGNPLVAAGQTLLLQGVGQFDGKWFIESAQHTVGPQYTTNLNIRRCLEGY